MDQSQQRCPTCRRTLPAGEFYANCAECKGCKKDRSRNHRALQARKVAAFERFVDVLAELAGRSAEPSAERSRAKAVA